jgi:uncharacterized protein YcbX
MKTGNRGCSQTIGDHRRKQKYLFFPDCHRCSPTTFDCDVNENRKQMDAMKCDKKLESSLHKPSHFKMAYEAEAEVAIQKIQEREISHF